MLYSCVVIVCATNVYTSCPIQIDSESYRSLAQKYRLPSQKCGRSARVRLVHLFWYTSRPTDLSQSTRFVNINIYGYFVNTSSMCFMFMK